jgi:hypothetical protein
MDTTRITLTVPESAAVGDSIEITAAVENVSDRAITLYLRGREPTFDIQVTNDTGRIVWRRLQDEIIPAVLRVATLDPGARITSTFTWNLRAQNGDALRADTYQISAHLLLETGRSSSAPIVFRVRARDASTEHTDS